MIFLSWKHTRYGEINRVIIFLNGSVLVVQGNGQMAFAPSGVHVNYYQCPPGTYENATDGGCVPCEKGGNLFF